MRKMHTKKMALYHRLLLPIVTLLCFANFGVYGSSTTDTNPVVDSTPTSLVPSQSPDVKPSMARTTYPRTPVLSSDTAVPSAAPASNPFEMSSAVFSTNPLTLIVSPQSPSYTPVKPTPLQWTGPTSQVPPSQPPVAATTLPWTLRRSPAPTRVSGLPSRAVTTIPGYNPPSSAPQRSQLTFENKYNDIRLTEYDVWTHRQNAQKQLANFCSVSDDRITNIRIEPSPSGNLVLRFTIEQGWPVYTEDAVQNLEKQLNASYLQFAGIRLVSPVAVYWTDNGPCPNDTCLNNGICDVTPASEYKCSCDDGFTGVRCQSDIGTLPQPVSVSRSNALFALLVLLAIPIAVAVAVGFVIGFRRQQKRQLKRAFDLRDVRTIGPRSMLSLPMEPGMRNQMYDTRSFALAFSDTTFSKSESATMTKTANEEKSSDPDEF